MSENTEQTSSSLIAIVTGGAKGIGLAVSAALADRGFHVVITGRDERAIDAASRQVRQHNLAARVLGLAMDVTKTASVNATFQEVQNRLGNASVLVNCAGIIARGPAVELADDEWDGVLNTDLTGVFRCCRAAFAGMADLGGGSIVNVGSIAGTIGLTGRVAYTTSKAGLAGLTRTLALEWAVSGIRVNTVAPGWTRTEMVAHGIETGQLDEGKLCRRIPQGRLAQPSEIANAIVFLASREASYITGQTLIVDGGVTINGDS